MSISPDLQMLDATLNVQRMRRAADWTVEEFFNFFAAECVMKVIQPSDEELIEGIVDGGGDCGIDAMYVVVNDVLLTPGFKYEQIGPKPHLQLVLIQAKTSPSFNETVPLKIASNLEKLLNPDRIEKKMSGWANSKVRDISKRFLDAYGVLKSRFPTVSVIIYYASRGEDVHPNVSSKQSDLQRAIRIHFPTAAVELRFLTASGLLDIAREDISSSVVLRATHQPLSTPDGRGHLCLVALEDYRAFLTSEAGGLNHKLFESNVRDWEGRTDINDEIKLTLESEPSGLDFWWLNNGVTIVASDVGPQGHSLVLENPQIVNGLQTSTQIFRAERRPSEDRSVLVRVILPPTTETRDQVIRATNNQHELSSAALRATERVQRNVEEFLLSHDLFYERRKNFYKNQGQPISKIVSMSGLAQADAAAFLRLPHVARADPVSLLSDDNYYYRMFGAMVPLDAHLKSLHLLRIVTQGLLGSSVLRTAVIDDLRFHMTAVIAMLMTGRATPSFDDVAALEPSRLSPVRVGDVTPLVAGVLLQSSGSGARTRVIEDMASDEDVTMTVLSETRSLLRVRAWQQWPESPVESYFRAPARMPRGRSGS